MAGDARVLLESTLRIRQPGFSEGHVHAQAMALLDDQIAQFGIDAKQHLEFVFFTLKTVLFDQLQ